MSISGGELMGDDWWVMCCLSICGGTNEWWCKLGSREDTQESISNTRNYEKSASIGIEEYS